MSHNEDDSDYDPANDNGATPPRRGPGRPPGAANKPKTATAGTSQYQRYFQANDELRRADRHSNRFHELEHCHLPSMRDHYTKLQAEIEQRLPQVDSDGEAVMQHGQWRDLLKDHADKTLNTEIDELSTRVIDGHLNLNAANGHIERLSKDLANIRLATPATPAPPATTDIQAIVGPIHQFYESRIKEAEEQAAAAEANATKYKDRADQYRVELKSSQRNEDYREQLVIAQRQLRTCQQDLAYFEMRKDHYKANNYERKRDEYDQLFKNATSSHSEIASVRETAVYDAQIEHLKQSLNEAREVKNEVQQLRIQLQEAEERARIAESNVSNKDILLEKEREKTQDVRDLLKDARDERDTANKKLSKATILITLGERMDTTLKLMTGLVKSVTEPSS